MWRGQRRAPCGQPLRRYCDHAPGTVKHRTGHGQILTKSQGGLAMSATDDLTANNLRYAGSFQAEPPGRPSRAVAVVACMDARMDVYALLGLAPGEAHVIRNAGGAVTEDVLRSLTVSQRHLGTAEVMLIHHTRCGMQAFTDDSFKSEIVADTGIKPAWATEAFTDVDADVLQSIARVRACPFLPHTSGVRGFVYDVATGLLREVGS
jgi:carbonic anhydrase